MDAYRITSMFLMQKTKALAVLSAGTPDIKTAVILQTKLFCYFPLKSRLQALLQLPNFMKFLQVFSYLLYPFDDTTTLFFVCSMKKKGGHMHIWLATFAIPKPGNFAENRLRLVRMTSSSCYFFA